MSDFDLSNLTFLIAEDNRFMLSILRQQLRAFEAGDIYEALDGNEAFELLCSKEIDIAIVDSGMTPVDGLSFTRHARTAKQSPNHELPVLMLVANADIQRIAAARDTGATEILTKPVSARMLYDRIQFTLNSNRQFIQADQFVGPDRRRRRSGTHTGEDRRRG